MFDDIETVFSDIGDVFTAVGDAFEFLIDPASWVRIFFILFGLLLIWGALHYGSS